MTVRNMTLSIESLEPHPKNFRLHPETQIAQLQKSYRRFGQFRSIVAQEIEPGKYLTVAGHGIVAAMKKEGVKDVRVDVLSKDVSPAEIEAILVADNYLSSAAEDDRELLTELLQEQEQAGQDLEALGFDRATFEHMLQEFAGTPEESGNLLELLDITIADPRHEVAAGDLWALERHLLFCVDVFRDWGAWTPYLVSPDHLFLPFAGPLVALSDATHEHRLIMVQPDTYIAGHILDRYSDIHGEASVKKMLSVPSTNAALSDYDEDEFNHRDGAVL